MLSSLASTAPRAIRDRLATLALLLCCTVLTASPLAAQAQPTVTIYGGVYPANEVVFLLDRSVTALSSAKAELQNAITSLTPSQSFTVIAFSNTALPHSPTLLPATDANKNQALAFIQAIGPESFGCIDKALLTAFGVLEASTSTVIENPLVFAAAGSSSCELTVQEIAAANRGGVFVASNWWTADFPSGQINLYQSLQVFSGPDYIQSEVRKGDVNRDELVNIADVILILSSGFGLSTESFCQDAADVAADGVLEPLSDAVTLIAALFLPSSPAAAAVDLFPADCEIEPQANGLTCYGGSCP